MDLLSLKSRSRSGISREVKRIMSAEWILTTIFLCAGAMINLAAGAYQTIYPHRLRTQVTAIVMRGSEQRVDEQHHVVLGRQLIGLIWNPVMIRFWGVVELIVGLGFAAMALAHVTTPFGR